MITTLSVWPIIKILVIILLGIYIVFAFVIVRQVQLMTDTLEVGFEKQLKFLAFLHFLFAIAVLIFSIIIL
ncbi:MAG: hypothetical protein ACD_19C00014G0005 [uncultured bacterium]|nr:MAG: hypothetical protein ACD_19C00014G0005 [uncultured bacterium]